MLRNIKSLFITKKVFDYISIIKKLKLLKYNKTIQKVIGIKIIDYKILSKRYIIYENGISKEYNFLNDKLLFEGEYLKRKRNGKGKEYNEEGNLIFEGEYLNGVKNGKAKDYYRNGKLYFEGEYKKGKKWNGKLLSINNQDMDSENNSKINDLTELKDGKGIIKEYNEEGTLIYEGEYLNGERNGKGLEYTKYGNLIYKGEYLNGKKWNGEVYNIKYDYKFKLNNGKQNNISNNMKFKLDNGNGYIKEYIKYFNDDSLLLFYEGEYLNGEKKGKGIEYFINDILPLKRQYATKKIKTLIHIGFLEQKKSEIMLGRKEKDEIMCHLIFEGEYLNGERNGKGKEYDEEGNIIFEGEYLNGKRNGRGKEYNSEGNIIFEGEYLNDYKRRGKAYLNNKLEYEGEYLFDIKYNGKGYDENGIIIYELINGKGTIREYVDGRIIYEGEYLNGKRNGAGKEYNKEGNLIFEGEYINGKRWNGKEKEYYYNNLINEKIYLNGKNWIETKYHQLKKKNINNNKEFIYIKRYDSKGTLISEGIFSNGAINGKGKEYDPSWGKLIFEGYYLNNIRNGCGKEYYMIGGLKFDGNYLNGERNGNGKEYFINGKLMTEGEYLNGKKNGKMKEYYDDGNLSFEGEYLEGKKWNGKGYCKNNNISYVIQNGKGLVKEYDKYYNLIFEGEYLNGERNGKGKEYFKGELIFEGEYLDGKRISNFKNK